MSDRISTIGVLFSTTWEQYKQRAIPILAVVMISTAVIVSLVLLFTFSAVFGGVFLAHTENKMAVTLIIVALVSLLTLFITLLALWLYTSMLCILIKEELGIIEAFQMGWQYFWPMTWVLTIFSGILLAGFILGILPGILFLVWFSFCLYILIEEDRRGMDSLLASMEYVKGYWWNTFGKLSVIWIISLVAGIIPFIGTFLSLLFYPFLMLFAVNMYHDLKEIKGEVEVPAGGGTRVFWWTVTVIGLVLPFAALAGGFLAVIYGDNTWFQYIQQSSQGVRL